ncbi:YHYH domain-containing protein [Saccharospirillum sp. HFRX-1]|uniref:YHYH domain-containing protein n=1 Tax=unclassified Saccharospirillum TaxID=2633430 RepID=UPI003713BC1D
MKYIQQLMALCFALAITSFALGHSGGTNAQGCHTNHRTGDYHCHTPKTPPANSVLYCHQINGESRCGYALSTCNNLVAQYGGRCVRQQ